MLRCLLNSRCAANCLCEQGSILAKHTAFANEIQLDGSPLFVFEGIIGGIHKLKYGCNRPKR
jgi:hypothetical protein